MTHLTLHHMKMQNTYSGLLWFADDHKCQGIELSTEVFIVGGFLVSLVAIMSKLCKQTQA